MKWYWKIYRIGGSYKTVVDIIGGYYPFQSLDKEYGKNPFIFVGFDGTFGGSWTASPTDLYYKTHEFKGSVGLKEIRKKKFEKIERNERNEIF